jgi:hypothetical protein
MSTFLLMISDQVAGDYIARDILCAATDARIVIIATQVSHMQSSTASFQHHQQSPSSSTFYVLNLL